MKFRSSTLDARRALRMRKKAMHEHFVEIEGVTYEADDQVQRSVITANCSNAPQRIVLLKPAVLNEETIKTGDCPIKEKIGNPVCINCKETGHLANWNRCVKFPKIQPKKGEFSQNKNKSAKQNTFDSSDAKVQNNLSFSNALKGKEQMAPPLDKSESANSKPDATPGPPKEKDNQNQPPPMMNLLGLWTQSWN
ncbi:hypothetical protein TNCV_2478731 [Trichonephila clavipes]|nr:hypothetical protein TNCV_2478731 [Trichonephila clavipes]